MLFGLVLIVSLSASTQETPKVEISLGYSYVRTNLAGAPVNLHGVSGSLVKNVNDWFGFVADVGGYHAEGIKIYTYLFGSRLSYRRNDKATPFFQASFGSTHASDGSRGLPASDNAFAMAIGGGLDVKIRNNVAIRFIQGEYLMTRLGSGKQNNARLTVGIVLRLGTK